MSLCSVAAVAQTGAKELSTQDDVRATIRQLVKAEQSPAADQTQAAQQAPAAAQDQVRQEPLIRIIPYGRNSKAGKRVGTGLKTGATVAPHLTYWGGPVMSNIQVVAVFWGANVAAAVTGTGTIDQFYTDITSSRYFDAMTEYYTAGITGPNGTSTSNQTIGHGTFGGKFTITPSVCPGTAACTISDAQIQTELTSQINSHALPAPQTDSQGNINTYYAVYFPPNVTIAATPTIHSCVQGGFCAYHSNTGSLIPYGVFPDFSSGGCSLQGACGSGTTLQIATVVSSHEMAETVTDPEGAAASVLGPPLGWFDGPNQSEIADLCDPFDTTVNAGSATYSVELLFSNLQNQCISAPPVFDMPSPVGGAGPSIPFKMTLTIRNSISNFIGALNYLGTVHFTSSDPGAVLPPDYTFTTADAGVHTFPFTLTVLGNQTITVTDTRAGGFTGTTTVNVNTVPDMTLTLQHSGNFGMGQTGAYTITASNAGGGPSSGTVTVVDTLPNGLTAAAMSGTGWTCNVTTVTCTRADALAAANAYPPITLTVNVGTFIGSPVVNVANVSGGGETITSDDQASDPTAIVNPGIDLAASIAPSQIFSTQGTTGVSFNATVGNGGSNASSGTVTVVATLAPGLTATNLSGTGWSCTVANLTCTRSDALASAQGYPPVTVTFDVALNAPLGFSSVGFSVSGGGDTNPADNSSSITIDITQALTIFSNTPTATIVAGGQAQYQVGVSGNTAAGTVTFSCSGLPAGASCSFNPPSLTNNSVFVIMSIKTTARGAVLNTLLPENRKPLFLPELLLSALAVLTLTLLARPRRKLVPVLGACVLGIAGILAGCGGGGSTPTTVTQAIGGTPAGTYTITFTATPSNTNVPADSRTMTLVVQ